MILLDQLITTTDGDLSSVQPDSVLQSSSLTGLIIIGALSVPLAILFIYLVVSRQKNKEAEESIFLNNKGKAQYNTILLLYNVLDSLPPTRKYLGRIRREFEMIAPGDGRFAKERATWITLFTWGGGILAIIGVLILKPTLYMILIVAFTVFVVSQESVNFIVNRNELELLRQFQRFLSRFRYHYLIDNTVDEAIYDSIAEVPHLMQLHARLILKVLQSNSEELDEQLLMYKNAVSNVYLKQFLAICTTTMQNGDLKVDGQSLCLTNIRDLHVDVDIELRKRKDIKANFSGASIMTVLPVYTLQIISNWGVDTIAALQSFYYGTTGTIAMLVCFAVTFYVYSTCSRLQEAHHQQAREPYVLRAICNLRPVKRFTTNYWDKNYGRKLKIEQVLKRTGSLLEAEHFLIQSLSYALVAFLLMLVIFAFSVHSTKSYIVSDYTALASETSSGTEEQMLIVMLLSKYYFDQYKDQDLVQLYNEEMGGNATSVDDDVEAWFNAKLQIQFEEGGALLSEEDTIDMLQQYNKIHSANTRLYTKLFGTTGIPVLDESSVESKQAFKQMNDIRTKAASEEPLYNTTGMYEMVQEEVLSKYNGYKDAYFHWYFFAIAAVVAAVAYKMPEIVLKAKEEELQVVMNDEVLQYQAIILLLIYFENVNALTILEWLNLFSDIFTPSIAKCITTFTMDESKALQNLYDEEPFEPFQRIVENLMMVDDVGVLQAFNELSATRKSNQETRSQDNKNVVAARASKAGLLVQIPLWVVSLGYLAGPLLVESFSQMTKMVTELSAM